MPEISRFLGIIITMYYDEHNPPHFHAKYGDYDIIVNIESGKIEGKFPHRALKLVLEWLYLNWNNMIKHVIEAKYIKDYLVWIKFNDGKSGNVDLKNKIWGEIFEPLKDINYFKKFAIKNDTLSWENGADIAPESLYDLLLKQN